MTIILERLDLLDLLTLDSGSHDSRHRDGPRMSAPTITVPAELAAEIADHLGGLGLATPGARLTDEVIADCERLADTLEQVTA